MPCHDPRCAPLPLPQHGAVRDDGVRVLTARDARRFRVYPLRDASLLPYGVVLRVRGVQLPYGDAQPPSLTLLSSIDSRKMVGLG
jgi:hypothetical protein